MNTNLIVNHSPETTEEEIYFLFESNAIENVHDQDSLQQAVYAWEYLMAQKVLDVHAVLKTHKILMLHQELQPDEKGYFRKVPVYVGRRECMPWALIPQAIENWCNLAAADGMDPRHLHVMYEKVHPFVDGNGRTGRMFMNWQQKKQGKQIITLKAAERWEYYKWFK